MYYLMGQFCLGRVMDLFSISSLGNARIPVQIVIAIVSFWTGQFH